MYTPVNRKFMKDMDKTTLLKMREPGRYDSAGGRRRCLYAGRRALWYRQ